MKAAALCLSALVSGARAWSDPADGLANFQAAAAGGGNANIALLTQARSAPFSYVC